MSRNVYITPEKTTKLLLDLEQIVRDDPNGQRIAAKIMNAFGADCLISSLMDRVLPLIGRLQRQSVIFDAIQCIIAALPEDKLFFLTYNDNYRVIAEKLPGGYGFTTVHWDVKNPNTYDYLVSELNARRNKVPESFRYTVKSFDHWTKTLRVAEELGAFGCSKDKAVSKVTFYFTNQDDEIMARLSL